MSSQKETRYQPSFHLTLSDKKNTWTLRRLLQVSQVIEDGLFINTQIHLFSAQNTNFSGQRELLEKQACGPIDGNRIQGKSMNQTVNMGTNPTCSLPESQYGINSRVRARATTENLSGFDENMPHIISVGITVGT